MGTVARIIYIIIMYLFITFGDAMAGSKNQTEALKEEYKDQLTKKNTIKWTAIPVAYTVSADQLVAEVSGKGYAFEEGEQAIKDFKAKYINQMIKVSGRIRDINMQEKTIIFENNVDCLWAVVNVRCVVDDPLIYSKGSMATVVGRCLGMSALGNLYIDGGQIEQVISEDGATQAVVSKIQFDKAMSAKEVIDLYYTYGNGNILFSELGNKKILITGYVSHTSGNKVYLVPNQNHKSTDYRVSINIENAQYIYKNGDRVSIVAKFNSSNDLLKHIIFDSVK